MNKGTQVNDPSRDFNFVASAIVGPHKEYFGKADYDSEADLFHGEVLGTRDVITFQGKTIKELGKAFTDSVDDYLEFCEESGEKPEKPFSGKFVIRISPDLHRKASIAAQAAGQSLNTIVCDSLRKYVNSPLVADRLETRNHPMKAGRVPPTASVPGDVTLKSGYRQLKAVRPKKS